MLESYCVKAKLQDGMDILDLGCGWGSLSLFLAKVRILFDSSTRPWLTTQLSTVISWQ